MSAEKAFQPFNLGDYAPELEGLTLNVLANMPKAEHADFRRSMAAILSDFRRYEQFQAGEGEALLFELASLLSRVWYSQDLKPLSIAECYRLYTALMTFEPKNITLLFSRMSRVLGSGGRKGSGAIPQGKK